MIKKFILAWAFFSFVFWMFLPFPAWLWGGAVAAAILTISTQ